MRKKLLLTVLVLVGIIAVGCGPKDDKDNVNKKDTKHSGSHSEAQAPMISNEEAYASVINGLEPGQGYAFASLNKNFDVLLVSDYTYQYDDATTAAINATIYALDESAEIVLCGSVASAGTAYPLAVNADNHCIYSGSGHEVLKCTVSDTGALVPVQRATENFDENGNPTYIVNDQFTADGTIMETLFDEWLEQANAVNFTTVEDSVKVDINENLYDAIRMYMIDEFGSEYKKADVEIPCINVLAVDDTSPEDVQVWGDFWYYNYDVEDENLMCKSSGNYPGLIHLKENEDGTYEVIKMEIVEVGDDFDESAREIFGDRYDDFIAISDDEEGRERIRAKMIEDYVIDNNLPVKTYQDEDKDPVQLSL